MSTFKEDTISVNVKKKNLSLLFDFCLENKIEFIVTPAKGNEEFTVGFLLNDARSAILLGMAFKELKLEPNGLETFITLTALKNSKKNNENTTKESAGGKVKTQPLSESEPLINTANLTFELENN
jgi:hypothetical protein